MSQTTGLGIIEVSGPQVPKGCIYDVVGVDSDGEVSQVMGTLRFQVGKPSERGFNGLQTEPVLEILLHRLQALNAEAPRREVSLAVTKLEERISVDLERDAYIAVEAFGGRTLFPVLQIAHWGFTNGTFPYAITNPVFVDVDGNGRFDPPWPRGIGEE